MVVRQRYRCLCAAAAAMVVVQQGTYVRVVVVLVDFEDGYIESSLVRISRKWR